MWRGLSTSVTVVVLALVGLQASEAHAQQEPTLPTGWQQMSVTDFASAIRPLFDQDAFKSLSEEDQNAAKIHGQEFFQQVDLSNTQLNYQTVEVLHHLARYLLDPSQIEKARSALLARQDNWVGQPYAEIRAKVVMMMRLEVPEGLIVNEARRWVQAGGAIAQVPQGDLQFDIVRQVFSDLKVIRGSFSVEWSGMLVPAQSGDYTFFISPINVNAGHSDNPVAFAMTVSLANQIVLQSSPSGNPNPLIAGYQPI